MDVRVLRYFVTVAREGSVTRAANFLHVTQPTLSRQIKELEEELGSRLFVRSNYSIKLTDEGMLLRKRAEDILDLVDKTKAEFLSLHDITGGDIRIGAAETYAMDYIAEAAENLFTQHPDIQYHLYSGNYEEVTERLDKGLLHFCLLVDPVDLTKYNQISLPAKDTWGVAMRKDNPLAEKKSIRPNDLIGLPLICSRQSLTHELSSWFGEKLDKLKIVVTYNLVYNASVLVNRGIGYLLCFDRLVNTSEESDLTFRPFRPKLESSLSIVWKKYQVFSPAEELFLMELQSMFRDCHEITEPT
jgi:DNA-binding transcriptional LysR family regulator